MKLAGFKVINRAAPVLLRAKSPQPQREGKGYDAAIHLDGLRSRLVISRIVAEGTRPHDDVDLLWISSEMGQAQRFLSLDVRLGDGEAGFTHCWTAATASITWLCISVEPLARRNRCDSVLWEDNAPAAANGEAGNGAPIGGLGVTVPRVMTWTLPIGYFSAEEGVIARLLLMSKNSLDGCTAAGDILPAGLNRQ